MKSKKKFSKSKKLSKLKRLIKYSKCVNVLPIFCKHDHIDMESIRVPLSHGYGENIFSNQKKTKFSDKFV
jgi:hypothetical protein